MNTKVIHAVLVTLLLVLVGATLSPTVRADEYNKKTIITFDQPIEIPGQILPAGTYTFKLQDSLSDRHIVQVWDADGTHLIATVLAINNVRLKPAGKTVVKFEERPADNPEALKVWFYPGDNSGQEFVYPKHRATELAVQSNNSVPSIADESAPAELGSAPVTEVAPQPALQPAPAPVATPEPAPAPTELPGTASYLPLVALIGIASLGLALGLKRFTS